MSQTTPTSATVAVDASSGRISATLLFSLLVHGMLLLGITFHFAAEKPSLPTLDVTLVNVANQQAPDKADFLAQVNNQGGGDSDKSSRPSQPYSGLLPLPSNGTAERPIAAAAVAPQAATDPQLLTTRGDSKQSVDSDSAHQDHPDQPLAPTDTDEQRQQEMAALAAEVRDQSEAYAKRPRKKFLSASTAEGMYAAYLHAWFTRVERIGNQNYPEEARRRHIHGDLELSVGLNRDGSIADIQVIRSSGQPVLDKAAKRIVQMSAPFPPWPADKDRTTILYIDRTWEFEPDNVFRHH